MIKMQLPPKKVTFTLDGRVASKKNSKQVGHNYRTGRIFVRSSNAFKDFEYEALQRLLELGLQGTNLKPPYVTSYLFEMKGKAGTDLDNMIASINDIIEKAEIIENDKFIERYVEPVEKVSGCKEYKTTVTVFGY